ncbi:MAG TPA: dipicolinate synthase subunit DpsA [Clostridiaceae bacterium]|nr:dipicolinate synthase subunit DpsA [Clostridiaceae bacterium]
MITNKKFTIIGGDLRSIKLADILAEEGNTVNIYGFNQAGFELKTKESQDLEAAIDESDVVIGPIPCSNDDENINAPFHSEKINVKEVFKIMKKNQLFVAGRISEKILQLAQIYNVYTVDLLQREELAVLNAIPTAEGAIQIAMEELPITLHNSNVLVLGFGRIGKILSKMLLGIGANVFCAARKYSDLASIKSYSYRPVPMNELVLYIPDMDVIFNTIPHMILDSSLLNKVNKDCLIIDLASKPGGIDFECAQELGLKVIWALSLPGKVAPVTAAYIIKETVYNIIDELGV